MSGWGRRTHLVSRNQDFSYWELCLVMITAKLLRHMGKTLKARQ